jgi:hypothetical protein
LPEALIVLGPSDATDELPDTLYVPPIDPAAISVLDAVSVGATLPLTTTSVYPDGTEALTVAVPVISNSVVVAAPETLAAGRVVDDPDETVCAVTPPETDETANAICCARLFVPEPIVTDCPDDPVIVIVAIKFSVSRQPDAPGASVEQLLSGSDSVTQSFSMRFYGHVQVDQSARAAAT